MPKRDCGVVIVGAGAPGPLPELHRVLFSRMAEHAALKARLLEALDRRHPPFDIISGSQVLWWTLAAAIRGRPQVIGELLAAGRRAVPTYREWRARRKLMADAEASA